MNNDFSYCVGTDAELCERCKRWTINNPVISSKYIWIIVPQEKNNKCKQFVKK